MTGFVFIKTRQSVECFHLKVQRENFSNQVFIRTQPTDCTIKIYFGEENDYNGQGDIASVFLGQGEIFRRNHDSVGGINKNKTIHCYFSKKRHISIVIFIQSNLLF